MGIGGGKEQYLINQWIIE